MTKNKLSVIFAMVCLVWSANAQSPICQSKQQEYSTLSSNEASEVPTLIRNYENYQIMHVQERVTESSPSFLHTFVIIDTLTHDTVYAQTDFGGPNAGNRYTCDIADMEIHNGVCYFCGSKTVDYNAPVLDLSGEIWLPQYVTYGFAGNFSISAILSATGTINHYQVPGTVRLTQMAVSTPYTYQCNVLLSMVGESDTGGYCLVELAHKVVSGGIYAWYATCSYIHESEEIFSDILSTPDHLVMVSQRTSTTDDFHTDESSGSYHGTFYLHMFSPDGCYYDDAVTSFIPYRAHYNISETNLGWHYDGLNMRLGNLDENAFCLAYGVEEDSEMLHGGARLHYFSDIYTMDSSIYYRIDNKVNPLDLRKTKLSSSLILLTTDDATPHGRVSIPSRHASIHQVNIVSHPYHYIRSIDTDPTNDFFDCSCYEESYHILTTFKQNRMALGFTSCLNSTNIDFDYTDVADPTFNSMEWWQRYTNREFFWLNANTTLYTAEKIETICRYDYEVQTIGH